MSEENGGVAPRMCILGYGAWAKRLPSGSAVRRKALYRH